MTPFSCVLCNTVKIDPLHGLIDIDIFTRGSVGTVNIYVTSVGNVNIDSARVGATYVLVSRLLRYELRIRIAEQISKPRDKNEVNMKGLSWGGHQCNGTGRSRGKIIDLFGD